MSTQNIIAGYAKSGGLSRAVDTLDKAQFHYKGVCIVNRGIWLRIPVNINEATKQAKLKIYVGGSLTLHI